MHFKRTAHLGALHVEGGQLPPVGLLLERRPEVKVHGSHSQVDSTLCERKYFQGLMFPPNFHATCHNVLLKFSGKSGFKRRSFKEVTKATGNWCERRSRWNMDEIASLSLIESKANAIRWCFHWDCRCLPHRSRSWTIELTSLDSSWWDCCIEWLFLFESIDTSGSLLSIYFILDEWYNWQRKITDTGNPSKTGRAGL